MIVVGAGTGGISAALQSSRLGASVLLIEETDWIGGQMCAAGVTSMDEGYPPRERVRQRGIYGEFRRRAVAYYTAIGKSVDTFAITEDHFAVEPHKAQNFLYGMIHDTRQSITPTGQPAVLDLLLRTTVKSVNQSNNRIEGLVVEIEHDNRLVERTFSSIILLDATEYGDVIPMTGAEYRLGSWISSEPFPENPIPPVQKNTWTAQIRKYSNGIPPKLVMSEKPPQYDESHLVKYLQTDVSFQSKHPINWKRFLKYRGMPDSTSPVRVQNMNGLLVTRSCINFTYNDHLFDIQDVHNEKHRMEAEYQCIIKTLQVIYYIQHRLGKNWSVANDIGYDREYNRTRVKKLIQYDPKLKPFESILIHFPPIPYVRESRRIIGAYTLKAKDLRRAKGYKPKWFPSAVAIGDYPIDVHGDAEVQKNFLDPGLDSKDDFPMRWIAWGYGPFQIPFEAFIPKTIDGFLPAEKNLSQTRLANGATRLQPSTMLTGQAAGAIAGVAVRLGIEPRELEPLVVQEVLLNAGSTLSSRYYYDIPHSTELWKSIQLATLYKILDYEEPFFHRGYKVSDIELETSKQRLRDLELLSKMNDEHLEKILDWQASNREMLARNVADSIRSAVDNPFRMRILFPE